MTTVISLGEGYRFDGVTPHIQDGDRDKAVSDGAKLALIPTGKRAWPTTIVDAEGNQAKLDIDDFRVRRNTDSKTRVRQAGEPDLEFSGIKSGASLIVRIGGQVSTVGTLNRIGGRNPLDIIDILADELHSGVTELAEASRLES